MNLNEVRPDRVREALKLAAEVLRGGPADRELVFQALLSDFAVDDDTLTDRHREQLEWLAELRRTFSNLQVLSVIGHASRTGPEPNNAGLSDRRARAVSTYLMEQGVPAAAIGEVRGVGSDPAILEVGAIEEPLNRSVEVVFTFRYVPRLMGVLPNPTLNWTIDPGPDLGWTFAGTQEITLTRLDTGESRRATFRYVDATVSVGPSKLLNKLLPNRWTSWDQAFDEMPTSTLQDKLNKFLAGFLLEATTSVAIVAGGGQPRHLAVDRAVDWEAFEHEVAFLLEPAAFSFPGADATYAMFLIGAPPFAGAYVSGIDPGVGSVFPELSAGMKLGLFELER